MAWINKSTIIYTLLTVILAIVYPFFEWRTSLNQYNESKIDSDFNSQLYSIIYGAKKLNQKIETIPIRKITEKNEKEIGFKLQDAQYSAVLSNYIYVINHDTFKYSNNAKINESLSNSPHNFPHGFNLLYLQLRDENDVNIKWALIENNQTNTIFLVLCGTDFLIDMLIDISISPLPLTYSSMDMRASKSWKFMLQQAIDNEFSDNFLVHGGISGSIQWLYSNVTNVLDSILTLNKKLIICGHSLGAGYSTVLAMRLITLYKNINNLNIDVKLYTFGAPAVLSGDNFKHDDDHPTINKLNKNTFNFINRFDIIPRLLGEQFDVLYPSFLWDDKLLLNQIKSFKPLGNYYILHDKNKILYGIDASNHDILSEQILKIIPRALFNNKDDARTNFVKLIFQFLCGKKYEKQLNYLLWLSFSAYPLLSDHSMDKYLSLIGDFSSEITFKHKNINYCLNSSLIFEDCQNIKNKKNKYKNDMQWRVTQHGQLQNLRNKRCIFMDWSLDNVFSWTFKYKLTQTTECNTKVTSIDYIETTKVFKILSDEHIEDYDSIDSDIGQVCLGCNVSTYKLNVYQCNQTFNDVKTLFHFNPHNIAQNEYESENTENNKQRIQTEVTSPWKQLLSMFDQYY